jgi:hypothetical protein
MEKNDTKHEKKRQNDKNTKKDPEQIVRMRKNFGEKQKETKQGATPEINNVQQFCSSEQYKQTSMFFH